MILQYSMYAISLLVMFNTWRLCRSISFANKDHGGNACFLGMLIAAALCCSAAFEGSPIVAGILMATGLLYPLVAVHLIGLHEQRDVLRRRAQELSQSLERLDDSATSRIASGESRFRDLAAVVPVGIFETNIEKQLVYVNKLLGEMTGLGARETRRDGFRASVHPDDREAIHEKWDEALTAQTVFEQVFRFQTPEDEVLWVVCLSHPRFVEGIYSGHVGMFMDVTERKRQDTAKKLLEQQTRRADRYESLGVFASGIAHDFNNLLVPMLGGADRLLRKMAEASEEHALAGKLLNAAQKASELSAQMLAYTGTMLMETELLRVDDFVSNIKNSIEAANTGNADLRFEIANSRLRFSSNPRQLRQAVINLVANALEALPAENGGVVVRCGEREFTEASLLGLHLGQNLTPGELPFIEIEDNGEGIPADNVGRIFDPFFTSRFTGRGLGLAVVSGIIKSIGGGIRIQSDLGRGTTVTVILPEASQNAVAEEPQSADQSAIRSGQNRLLVIDDEEGVREFVHSMLEANGHETLLASDGIEGLKVFRRELPSIAGVILDLTMPAMDGEEVLDHLVAMDKDVRVLITSGFAKADVMTRLANRKIVGFLAKPFTERQLLDGVKSLLKR